MVLIPKLRSHLKNILVQTEQENPVGEKFNTQAAITLLISAFSLTCIYYLGSFKKISTLLLYSGFTKQAEDLLFWSENMPNRQLVHLAYWVAVLCFFYIVLPLIIVKFWFKESLHHYGLSINNALKKYKVYVYFFLFMVPLVFAVSFSKSFQDKYPFYDLSVGEKLYPNFVLWQLLYFIQFIGVEFFFRGFMLHGTKKGIGVYSVFVMVIPYCMIHFGKPMPETIAAIIAGVVLGFLSLRSKSIWLGVAIHYSVAITMDLLSLWQKGFLF